MWFNWKECIQDYPDVKPLFQVCGDQRFVQLHPACALSLHAFAKSSGYKSGNINLVKLAQQFAWGHNVFEAGTTLSKVRNNFEGSYRELHACLVAGSSGTCKKLNENRE
jgi:hypothetical protein